MRDEDEEFCGDQAVRIECPLFAAGLGAQRLACGLGGLGRFAQDDQAYRREDSGADQGLNVDLVRQVIVRQGLEVITG